MAGSSPAMTRTSPVARNDGLNHNLPQIADFTAAGQQTAHSRPYMRTFLRAFDLEEIVAGPMRARLVNR